MFESEPTAKEPQDVLFLERLETFMSKALDDIKVFAQREGRTYDETRRSVAQWHAKSLFEPLVHQSSETSANEVDSNRANQVRMVLTSVSDVLDSLSQVAGVQSFVLAVDPIEAGDSAFLGGSVTGREFWRGMRYGGVAGARAFKTYSLSSSAPSSTAPPKQAADAEPSAAAKRLPPQSLPKPINAKTIKTDLYDAARNALRLTSGKRTAEMKWTNPERLDTYGVRLVGWPADIPFQNPSTLKVHQNKTLLEGFQKGDLKFERILPKDDEDSSADEEKDELDDDFSWAYDANALPSSPIASTSTGARVLAGPAKSAVEASASERDALTGSVQADLDAAADVEYDWESEFVDAAMATETSWHVENSNERPRKRPRNTETPSPLGSPIPEA